MYCCRKDFMACVHMQSDLKEAEDLALDYMSKYERADQQRTELYYQAKSSNALAAKTLMDSLSGAVAARRARLWLSSARFKWWSRQRRYALLSSRT